MINRLVRFFLSGVVLAALPLIASGCIYSNVKLPLDTDVSSTELGTKIGEASVQSVLWLVGWGDASTAAAAKNGDIKVIKHLDLETFSLLFGLYSKNTTIAYGD